MVAVLATTSVTPSSLSSGEIRAVVTDEGSVVIPRNVKLAITHTGICNMGR